jgi:hypothetical protein
MKTGNGLTRGVIIRALVDALEPLDFVYAFWEGGAAAFNRIDEWSDVDLYLVVDDEKADETFLAVERALRLLSPIKQKYGVLQLPWPGVSQAFYRLEGASEYLVIDLAVMKLSSPDKFLEPEIHGNVVFFFNKFGRVKSSPLDKDAMVKGLKERLGKLRAKFEMFNSFVQKEINRRNNLEAIDLYRVVTLATVVEALRIKYNAVHHDFKMRYIHYELPTGAIEKLEHLYFVKDEEDLQRKYREAADWFRETMLEIDQKEIERQIRNL